MPSTQTPLAPDTPLITDLPCAKCHYNLRTKKPSELCPECAHPVADSIHFHHSSAIPNPRRAAQASLRLAVWSLSMPLAILIRTLLFVFIDDFTRTYVIAGPIELMIMSIGSTCLLNGILLLPPSAMALTPRKYRIHRLAIILAALYLIVPLSIWVKAISAYFLAADNDFDWGTGFTAQFFLTLPYVLSIFTFLILFLLLFLGWRFMRSFVPRLQSRPLRIATSVLFISTLITKPILLLISIATLLELWWVLFVPTLGPLPAWWSALQLLETITLHTDLALMFTFTLYWLTLANLFRKMVPNSTPSSTSTPELPPATIVPA